MIIETRDLAAEYGLDKSGDSPSLTCYYHNDPETLDKYPRRAILIMPGGGYSIVSAREAEPVAIEFYNRDFTVFVLRYSVAPGSRYPAQLIEAACAADFIRKNADRFGIVKDKLFAMGFSAGGHLAGSLANLHESASALYGKKLYCRLNGIALCYPVINDETGYDGSHRTLMGEAYEKMPKELKLDLSVKKDNPPAFLWHTAADDVVPSVNSLLYAAALAKYRIPYELHVFPVGGHGLSTCDSEPI